MRQPVELEIADAIDHLLAAAVAPRQHLDPRQQLRERIGLGQVIVAAGAQPLDPVVDLAEGGEDQGGSFDALAAQRPDDGEAVELGQHAVDDQDVVLAVDRVGETLLAVSREVGDVAYLAERLGEIVGRIAIVFDDEKSHDDPVGGPVVDPIGPRPPAPRLKPHQSMPT